MISIHDGSTICALATPAGHGAIAVIRLSGKESFSILQKVFHSKKNKKDFSKIKSHTLHFGFIKNADEIIDEVLVSVFRNPHSYTGEDVVEISCHGSTYIQQKILQLLINSGARSAEAGEFTMRAFLNGKFDLSQAEAVADLIASETQSSHQLAMQQMRGGFSSEIKKLRSELIHFASLVELELDFSEEDVEFANREQLKKFVSGLRFTISGLLKSFELGNVLKNGVPVVIAGKPNVGKSTLLNVLLNEERAIVSHIAGTTRDVIEDVITLDGIRFRFIDTAGLRDTSDVIESIGVERALQKVNEASIVIYVFDASEINEAELLKSIEEIQRNISKTKSQIILVANKSDKINSNETVKHFPSVNNIIFLSAKNKINIEQLTKTLVAFIKSEEINSTETIVHNARHAASLQKAEDTLQKVLSGLESKISNDFLAADIRYAINCLGEITGEITTDDLLESIFSKFCIGK